MNKNIEVMACPFQVLANESDGSMKPARSSGSFGPRPLRPLRVATINYTRLIANRSLSKSPFPPIFIAAGGDHMLQSRC